MPRATPPSKAAMDRGGLTYPIKICPRCNQYGPIMYDTKLCVACVARSYNEQKKLTLNKHNG